MCVAVGIKNLHDVLAPVRSDHLGAHGCCMGKAGAVPSQVFAHAYEALGPMNGFETLRMIDHRLKFFIQTRLGSLELQG